MLQIQQQIIDLISLAVGRPLTPPPNMRAEFAVPSSAIKGHWAELWFEREAIENEAISPHKMMFTFAEIRDTFDKMLRAWRTVVQEVNPTYQLYFATVRSSKMYAEHKLFNMFQALESYHRRAIPVDQQAKQASLARRDKIINSVADEDRGWLKEKLAFSHEPSASERLKALTAQFDAGWIFKNDPDNLIQRIAKVRNYLTHYGSKPPDEDLDPARVMNFAAMLQVLCEVIFLHCLGLSSERANLLLKNKRRLQSISLEES